MRVAFDQEGGKFVSVHFWKQIDGHNYGKVRVFTTSRRKRLFKTELTCVIERDTDRRAAFWPVFIRQGSQILIKRERKPRTTLQDADSAWLSTYDVTTGAELGDYPLGGSSALIVAPDPRLQQSLAKTDVALTTLFALNSVGDFFWISGVGDLLRQILNELRIPLVIPSMTAITRNCARQLGFSVERLE